MLKQKMVISYFFIILPLLPTAFASSYQFISFAKPGTTKPPTKAQPKLENLRTARSFYHPVGFFGNSENLLPNLAHLPPTSVIDFSYVPKELTQFSHDLTDYHDPLLLTGNAARIAVRFLYAKSLFFSDYPHISALLKNQDKRLRNGLAGNRLGSIRLDSPFLRRDFAHSPF